MLIRFHTKTGGFTIQGDIGVALLRLMGMSGSVPGALLAQDVPHALERLKQSVAAAKSSEPRADDAEASYQVSLTTRAFPLVQLLEDAARKSSDVVWEELGKSSG